MASVSIRRPGIAVTSSSVPSSWPVTAEAVSWLDGVRQGEQAAVEGRRLVASGGATAAGEQGVGEVRVPAGVVLQGRGHLPPDTARAMAEALPRGRLAVIPGCGHTPPVERPVAVAEALLDFLRAHWAGHA